MHKFHYVHEPKCRHQRRANYQILPIVIACATATASATLGWAGEQSKAPVNQPDSAGSQSTQPTRQSPENKTRTGDATAAGASKNSMYDEDLAASLRQDIVESEKEYGTDSMQATNAKFAYVKVLKNKGKDAEAEKLCRAVLAAYQKLCGPESVQVAEAEDHLGRILRHQYRIAEAETHQRKALALCKKLFPPGDPKIAAKMEDLAKVLALLPGRRQEAKALYLEAYEIAKQGGNWETADYIAVNLATSCLLPDGETAEARKYVSPVLESFAKNPNMRADSRAVMLMLMGASYAKDKQFELAKSYYQQALSIFQNYAPNHPKVATCYAFMSDDEIKQGNYVEASKELLKAIEISPNHSSDAFDRLFQQQRFAVIDIYQGLIDRKEKNISQIIAIEYQTLKAIQKDPHKNSIELLEQIYKSRRTSLGIHNALTNEAALQLAVQLRDLGGNVKPLVDLSEPEVTAFAQELLNGKSKAAVTISTAPSAVQLLGNKNKALDFAIENLLLLAELRGEEKEFLSAQHDLALAEKCLDTRYPQSKSSTAATSSSTTLAASLLRIASIWLALGKYNRAAQLTESAIALIIEQKTDSELKYRAYLQLGTLNLAESDTESAINNAQIAETVANKLFGTKSNKLVPCYRLLSQIKLATGDYKDGSSYALKALLCSDLSTNDEIWIRNSLGFCALSEGRYEDAKKYLTQALNFCNDSKNNQPEDRSLFTAASTALAEALVKIGDREEALRELDWALSTDQSNSQTESLLASARDAAGIATVHWLDGDKELASSYALQAADFTNKFLQSGFSELSFAQQCSFVNVTRQIRSILLNTCSDSQNLAQAYGYIIRWKGLLLESLRSQSIITSASATASGSTQKSIAELSAVRARLGALANGGEETIAEFNNLSAKKERIERELVQGTSANTISDPLAKHDVHWFQNLLKPNQAFLDVLTFTSLKDDAEHYALMAMKAGDDGNLYMIDLGQTKTIDEQIGKWRNNITQQFPRSSRGEKVASRDLKFDQDSNHATLSSEEYLKLTNELAKLFVNNAELNKFLGANVNQVWLCPEAAMTRMPWDTLSTICGIESFKICEIDSPREFVQILANHSEPKSGEHLLLAGVSSFHDSEFNDLPGTEKEINGIEAEAKRAGISYERLLDDQATKTNVRSKIEASTAVHFSTHGFARGDKSAVTNNGAKGNVYFGLMSMTPSIARNPLTDSGLVLSPGLESSSPRNADEKPLLTATSVSGPKWRGMSDSQTSKRQLANLLTAEEIVGLNLRNCRLVSLSACKTGLGTGLDGQGVLGLRSAIMAAGARSILMSLWSVDDDATEELMKKFYSYLLDPQAPVSEVEALRKAQDYIRAQPQWQSPNYWAGWVIAGDGWQSIRASH